MNKKYIFKGIAVIAAIGLLPACSDDYLDLAPESSISTSDLAKNVESCELAVRGIASAMQTQYQGTEYNQYNGENWLNTIYGEGLGQDDIVGLALGMYGKEIITGGAPWGKDNYVLNYIPWSYCYNLIQQSNAIIDVIDGAEGEEEYRNFVKAQALTFRAHGYTKLMQYYAPRWEDSRNGAAMCAVYRVKGGISDAPLCSMNEVMDLIYSDLTTAIDLYEKSGDNRRDVKWMPDIAVAKGIFARAALIKHDWTKAEQMAHEARQNYPIMDNDTYLSGFIYDNSEIMWTESMDPADIYYWSFGSHFAVNGIYVKNWGDGAGAIDYDFYKTLDENDIRRQMFLTPDKVDVLVAENKAWNPGKVTEAEWWNKDLVVESSNVDLSLGPYARKDAIDGKWGLYNIAIRYCRYYGESIFTGNYNEMNNEGFMNYYTIEPNGKVKLTPTVSGSLSRIPFGAQFKFWSEPPYGVSAYPFMRGAEMCLIEAEAAYEAGHYPTALKCLKEVQSVRIPGYDFNGTGEALRDEIRKARRIELWGEGFSFTDFKRWNLPIVRRAWVSGDPTSSNWMLEFGVTTPANKNGGWRLLVPRSEYEYNSAIDRNLLEYPDQSNE